MRINWQFLKAVQKSHAFEWIESLFSSLADEPYYFIQMTFNSFTQRPRVAPSWTTAMRRQPSELRQGKNSACAGKWESKWDEVGNQYLVVPKILQNYKEKLHGETLCIFQNLQTPILVGLTPCQAQPNAGAVLGVVPKTSADGIFRGPWEIKPCMTSKVCEVSCMFSPEWYE